MSAISPIRFAGEEFPPDTEVVDLVNARPVSLDPLGELPRLRVLRLHHTNPHTTPGGMPLYFTALRGCPQLAVIDVPGQSVPSLDGLQDHHDLQFINVSSTRINDIGPVAGLPNLTVLRLRHTRVADLTPLASVPSLEELDVAHSLVGDITPLGGLARLSSLDLRATRVTDLSALDSMPSLRRVVVQRLDVEPSAIDRLRRARPDLDMVT